MAKVAKRNLEVDPWVIREVGFHPERSQVSESIFAVANEFAGVRGSFEEGYSGKSMPGFYFNGIYEKGEHKYAVKFKGFADYWTHMVNGVDWLYTRIILDGEQLDLATSKVDEFVRQIDMRRCIVERSFVWKTKSGKQLYLKFERFLSMDDMRIGAQRISFKPLNFSDDVDLTFGLDFGTTYYLRDMQPWAVVEQEQSVDRIAALGRVESSGHRVFAAFRLNVNGEPFVQDRLSGQNVTLSLTEGETLVVEKLTVFHTEKDSELSDSNVWKTGLDAFEKRAELTFADTEIAHLKYWADVWAHLDVVIEGDDENQQGFRYCIFHLHQTYHGADPSFNVGAKGLTGEAYWGVTWWDTETYCLPFYIFNNRKAARNLIDYRYRTLPGAKGRAADFKLPGARYPMCTIDGEETCEVWQHGDLEIHVSAAVAYGVWKYVHLTGDTDFLFDRGAEILVEVARFYAARGGWGQQTGKFGFWGVMGPDEMHTMVNNNAYTNFMAKKSFEWAFQALEKMEREQPGKFQTLEKAIGLKSEEIADWKNKAEKMDLMLDPTSGIYQQHDGYFNMPHMEYNDIPDDQFPVLQKWAYIDLFRYDLIKQPDVLLFFFLFGTEFDQEALRKNFEYYESRCSHESSLSPSIHSILAVWLEKGQKAFDYSRYASRLDLDDYNNNTHEGLHVTSMAGAWMNLIYGFGGLKSDGDCLSFHPVLPKQWTAFSYRLYVMETAILTVHITQKVVRFSIEGADSYEIEVCGETLAVTPEGVTVSLKINSVVQGARDE